MGRIQLKPIHQAIETDQIHQDSKSRSEEEINRIDEYGASGSNYDSIPTSEVYDQDDNDDGESYIEFENEKKVEPKQIHQDPERRSEEEINRFNKHAVSDSNFESNTLPRISDHDDSDHATRSEEEVKRIQLKPIHQAIESDQIHQDSKSRSEEKINRFNKHAVSDSDFEGDATQRIKDHADSDHKTRTEEEINRIDKYDY